ncbi:MAG: bifunctional diguanylate cyclase/phosphodiesterase [Actinomycetes bacterium]
MARLATAQRRIAAAGPVAAAMAQAAAQALIDLVGATGSVVSLRDGDELIARGVAGTIGPALGSRMPRRGSLAGLALATGDTQVCTDAAHDPRTDPARSAATGVGSSVTVPMRHADEIFGALQALAQGTGAFSAQDVELVELLADAVALRMGAALATASRSEISHQLQVADELRGTVFEALDSGLVVHDSDGSVVAANLAAATILGATPGSLVGDHRLDDGFAALRPDGTAWPAEEHPTRLALQTSQAQRGLVMGVDTPDQGRRWLSVTALPIQHRHVPVESSSRHSGVVTVFADVTATVAAQASLLDTSRRLIAAQSLTGLATWEWDVPSGVLVWSDQMFRIVGLEPGGVTPTIDLWLSFLHPEDRDECASLSNKAIEQVRGYENVFRICRTDGAVRVLHAWNDVVAGPDGRVSRIWGATLDVTERTSAAQLLVERENQFRVAFDNAPIGMTMISLDEQTRGRIVAANPQFARMVGRTVAELASLTIGELTHPDDIDHDLAAELAILAGESATSSFEKRYVRPDGEVVHVWVTSSAARDDRGVPQYLLAHSMDITDTRRAQAELERLARTDTLTGLANRATLDSRLAACLDQLRWRPGRVGLVLADLDRFKLVNDSLGHEVGDALLVEAARRISRVVRAGSLVARLGGDEFVVLDDRMRGPDDALSLAGRLVEALREPYDLGAAGILVRTASVGVAIADRFDQTPAGVLRNADLALYAAKDAGRDRYALYDDDLHAQAVRRLDAEGRVRRALVEDRLRLYLQPILDARTGKLVGSEALVRIRDTDGTVLTPGAFIEAAEESGLIVDIDAWMAATGVAHLAGWQADPRTRGLTLGVNVSARSLVAPRFLQSFGEAITAHAIDCSALRIELTERSLFDASTPVHAALDSLRDLGARLGLDDFGTGYSALAYLPRFDLHFLKIDQSFVAETEQDPRARTVIRAIVDLAHAHDLLVVAEGVETPGHLRAVRDAGVDLLQGFLLGPPTPADRFDAFAFPYDVTAGASADL